MGRRCCCGANDCIVIDTGDKLQAKDFFEVFSATGDFEVECWQDAWERDNDTITFNGSVSLNLIYPEAIFSGDNFAITFNGSNGVFVDNLSVGDITTETLTFTLGSNTLEISHSSTYGSTSDSSFIVYYNSQLLYTKTAFDVGYYNVNQSLLGLVNYLIRKDGKLQYYLLDSYATGLFGVTENADLTEPIQLSYSWVCSSSDATIAFTPQFLRIWKPDRWWLLAKYRDTVKRIPGQLSDFEAHRLYDVYANNEVEDQGCEAVDIYYDDSLVKHLVETNNDVLFSEQSPKIALKFKGIKGGTTNIAGIPEYAWHNEPDGHGGTITIDDLNRVYNQINALTTPVVDLDGIMTDISGAWEINEWEYDYKWINGATVTFNYTPVSSQILNAVTGGTKITFQQMCPMTVMYNNEWYYPDAIDESNNPTHQGFRGYNRSWGRGGTDEFSNPYATWTHAGGSQTNCCRLDPFAYYYNLSNPSAGYSSNATDLFTIYNVTLELRKGIVAPDIDINLSPHGEGVIDFKFNKPDTNNYTPQLWRTSHIVDVNILTPPSHASITKTWYADSSPSTGGYYKLQYVTPGGISAPTDYFIYELEDQFGAKSKGLITIHFTGDTLAEHKEKTVSPESNTEPELCNDYDTICEVTCTVPFGLSVNSMGHKVVTPTDICLYYVHKGTVASDGNSYDGKTVKLSDLIGHEAELKTPATWTSIDGTLQDTIKVEFVNPVHECDLAHDYNFGLENSILQTGEVDNVSYLTAHIQAGYVDNQDVFNPIGNPLTCTLNPESPVGCPLNPNNQLNYGTSGNSLDTVYSGSFVFSREISGTSYTGTGNIQIVSGFISSATQSLTTLPYTLDLYLYPNNIYYNGMAIAQYYITQLTVVYESGKTIDINVSAINRDDYPKLVLGDFYND